VQIASRFPGSSSSSGGPESPGWLAQRPLARLVAYYALLLAAGSWLWRVTPPALRERVVTAFAPLMLSGDAGLAALLGLGAPGGTPGATAATAAAGAAVAGAAPPIALAVAGAAIGAFLLSVPVAWTYMIVRERKGYRQTTVHTLVLLPVVVAGIVVLVKTSLALAFSLAGIVAAVRFRNTLDDSKDATFLFLGVGVGLAAGVELDVALVLSVLFNAATLTLFYTDFARTPPGLEGERARRQLERATAIANRTSQFVARVDAEVLQALAPEQLDALATRVRRRREEAAPDLPSIPELEFDARLCVALTDVDAARAVVEPVLETRVKRWARERVDDDGDGVAVVAYHVRWKKGTTPNAVLDAVRAEGAPFVVRAEIA
jgi:hypothetical protein